MPEPDDITLLREFAATNSETAFATLVRRHVNMVYSTALRRTANPQAAEEITQAVFVVLARKARSLGDKTLLPGWLYHTARLTTANFVRTEIRRHRREQEALMQSPTNEREPWTQIAPLLDHAMAGLGERDRNAIVLRYFEDKSLAEVGAGLGTSEDAARVRVNRALEKLRKFFGKRGVTLSATALAAALTAHSTHAAPAGLASTVAATSSSGAVAGSTLALAKVTLSTLTWARYKVPLGLAAVALLAVGVFLTNQAARHSGTTGTRATPPMADSARPAAIQANAPLAEDAGPPEPREPFSPSALFTLASPPGAVAVQPDGRVLIAATVGGWFVDEFSGTLGWYTRGAMRFGADGSLDRSFYCDVGRPEATAAFMSHLSLSPDGRVLVSGLFDAVDGLPRPGYSMLLPDGRVDESFTPWRGWTNVPGRTFLPGGTYPATLLNDGTVAIMSGAVHGPRAPHPWTAYHLDTSGRLIEPVYRHTEELGFPPGLILTLGWGGFWARKPVDWTREAPARPFHWMPPGTQRPPVTDLAFDQWTDPPTATQAAIVFQQLFEEVPMELCRYAAKLPDGGTVLAVGDGTPLKSRGHLMRFDKDWRPDFRFTNSFEADYRSWLTLRRLPDGRLLFAGLVGTIDGEEFPGLVRLQADGPIDRSFRCETANGLAGRIFDFAVQPDGRILIVGDFTQVNGEPAEHVARLNADGSIDPTFKTPFVSHAEFTRRRFVRVARLSKQPAAAVAAPATSAGPTAGTAPGATDAETILITSLDKEAGATVVHFRGAAGRTYLLQAKDALNSLEWTTASSTQAGPGGSGTLRDNEASQHPMRFYRIAQP